MSKKLAQSSISAISIPDAVSDRVPNRGTNGRTAVTAPRRKIKSYTFELKHGVIAVAIVALFAGALWATKKSSKSSDNAMTAVNKDALLIQYSTALKEGKTCKQRLAAVKALHLLNDKRAIPDLKRARRRMRGGTLGIGAKNTNRCLRKAAKAAIKKLSQN